MKYPEDNEIKYHHFYFPFDKVKNSNPDENTLTSYMIHVSTCLKTDKDVHAHPNSVHNQQGILNPPPMACVTALMLIVYGVGSNLCCIWYGKVLQWVMGCPLMHRKYGW